MTNKTDIKVERFDRTTAKKAERSISIQFPEKGYFINKWLSDEEAQQLITDLQKALDEK
jgi:hypothetical protein